MEAILAVKQIAGFMMGSLIHKQNIEMDFILPGPPFDWTLPLDQGIAKKRYALHDEALVYLIANLSRETEEASRHGTGCRVLLWMRDELRISEERLRKPV